MSVKERIKNFIQTQGITVIEFEKSINASNGYVNSIHKSIGIEKMSSIIEKYPILNIEWLLTGNGSMLKNVRSEASISPVDFFSTPVPTPPPEPPPPALPPNDSIIAYVMKRNEELVAENALLKKEVDDLKMSRGKATDPVNYKINEQMTYVAEPRE